MLLEAAKCKTDEEKKAFAYKIHGKLSDEALNNISGGGEPVADDCWECEVCGAKLDSFWDCFTHAASHIGDIF